ncbi:hypothetical protein [Pseudomonas sp. 2FE]
MTSHGCLSSWPRGFFDG